MHLRLKLLLSADRRTNLPLHFWVPGLAIGIGG